jgi:hypothetical protein
MADHMEAVHLPCRTCAQAQAWRQLWLPAGADLWPARTAADDRLNYSARNGTALAFAHILRADADAPARYSP